MYLRRCLRGTYNRLIVVITVAVYPLTINAEQEQPSTSKGSVAAIKAGAIVVGVTAISCILIPRVRKMCREALSFMTNDNVARQDQVTELNKIDQLRREVKDDIQLLADEIRTRQVTADEDLHSMLGRQANFNGFTFENATADALPRLLNELFPRLRILKTARNVEGYYSVGDKIKQLEFDTIAISDQHVFVIESKIGLKRSHIDKFIKKLNNFSSITFDNKELNKELVGKKVHGGLSYMFDGKWHDKDNLERAYLVSRYARDTKKLLTIHRLNSAISSNLNLGKLQDFNRTKVKGQTNRRLSHNSRWR